MGPTVLSYHTLVVVLLRLNKRQGRLLLGCDCGVVRLPGDPSNSRLGLPSFQYGIIRSGLLPC